jgi:quercetin dioxygenase-like cupin family protein
MQHRQVVIINESDIEVEVAQRGRPSNVHRKRFPLDSGVPGVTLEFTYNFLREGYTTPRHRHNFDQIRYSVAGVHNTGAVDLKPGECGYFPEGAYYGPQEQKGDCVLLLLQFQGPNGEPFLGNEAVNVTFARLLEKGGIFKDGVYTGRKEDGGKINKDSYTALWEEAQARALKFTPPRYPNPIIMSPDQFQWQETVQMPGIRNRHLGTFTELRTSISMLKIEPGASIQETTQDEAEVRYLTSGSFEYDGKTWGPNTYIYLPPGARSGSLVSPQGATFFCITLPMIAQLEREHASTLTSVHAPAS